jgi:hypothetical protein
LHNSRLFDRLRLFFGLRFVFRFWFRFNFAFGFRFNCGFRLSLDSRFRLFLNRGNVHRFGSFHCRGRRFFHHFHHGSGLFRCQRAKLLAKLFRQTVFDRVGVRRYGHTHVLQFTNDFGIVEIQFPG